jgi:hypothetical protein
MSELRHKIKSETGFNNCDRLINIPSSFIADCMGWLQTIGVCNVTNPLG